MSSQTQSGAHWKCRECGEQLEDLDAADIHNGETGHYVVPTENNQQFDVTEEA